MIVKANRENLKDWAEMSALLFPWLTFEEALAECEEWLRDGSAPRQTDTRLPEETGYLYQKDGKNIGFINLSVRTDYVNGTETSPVVFVEAIYIMPEYRKLGIGREFISFAEKIARDMGISEIASDCFLDDAQSEKFHKSCGFIEMERVICFAKKV